MFTGCRLTDRVGVLVQWMSGAASSAIAFKKLEPIIDLIQSAIFGFAEAQLTTVRAGAWADTKR